jgi:uncharacterized protein YceH (UPF0502 family)
MIELTADEARVIGVLIEKAQTTPDQYPLTVNGVVNGANQKNNRDPITALDEGDVRSALISLRNKGLVVQQDAPGQRSAKFRHQVKEKLGINTPEMVVLAELLLRGPQSLGEIRGRASRMHPIDTLEMAKNVVDGLIAKAEPMVRQLPPAPGSRAERYVQLLCPDLHPTDVVAPPADGDSAAEQPHRTSSGSTASLAERVASLEAELAILRRAITKLAAEIGAADPLASSAADDGAAPSAEHPS